jgi:hypothetical protein
VDAMTDAKRKGAPTASRIFLIYFDPAVVVSMSGKEVMSTLVGFGFLLGGKPSYMSEG